MGSQRHLVRRPSNLLRLSQEALFTRGQRFQQAGNVCQVVYLGCFPRQNPGLGAQCCRPLAWIVVDQPIDFAVGLDRGVLVVTDQKVVEPGQWQMNAVIGQEGMTSIRVEVSGGNKSFP